jgi:xanthine dehydrogenase molybdenum-binding subunit
MAHIKKESLIGGSFPKLDAPDKATGRAVYIHDVVRPRMLYGAIRRTDRVSARIVAIHTEKAKALPGVRTVITAADIENVPFGHGRDNTPLKGDKVRCIRDEIAAVAADTMEIAREACRLIEVEYEDLPAVFDAREAMKPGAPVIHQHHEDNIPFTYDYSHGDVAAGERESDAVVEETYHLHYVTHCCLGTSGIVAEFDANDNLTLHSVTQIPFMYKRDLGRIVGVPPEKIRVIQATIGGGFGSKLDIYPYEPVCVHLARAAKRPVKIVFDRREEFIASPTRQPVEVTLRAGAKKDGTLTFRDARLLLDNGGYTSWGATTPFVMMQTFSSLYRVPNVRFECTVVYTNNPYAGSMRGYGNLQATFAVESMMDSLAEKLGMEALELRRKNAQVPGEETGQGMVFTTCGLDDCLTAAAKGAGWSEKRRPVGEGPRDAPAENGPTAGRYRRGIGMASLLHVGGGAKIYRSDGCGTILKIDDFGVVTVLTGSSEIGQGSETVIAQITAETLGVPMASIRVVNNDTDLLPWDVGVHASRTTFVAGNSARRAALKAKEKLLAAAGEQVGKDPAGLDTYQGHVIDKDTGERIVELDKVVRKLHFSDKNDVVITTDYYEPPSVMQDGKFKGNVSPTYAFGTHVVEVEVDTWTGVVKPIKVTAAHDIGRVINQMGVEGQVQGGVAMGLGYCLSEELKVEGGRVLNPSFLDYRLMTATEMPEIEMHFIETHDPEGPFGAKGIGEAPAICLSPALANAVYDAIGIRFRRLPLTPERVLAALQTGEEGKA